MRLSYTLCRMKNPISLSPDLGFGPFLLASRGSVFSRFGLAYIILITKAVSERIIGEQSRIVS